MKTFYILFLIMMVICLNVFSQGTDFRFSQKKYFVGFSCIPGQTSFIYKQVTLTGFSNTRGTININLNVESGYNFNKYLGISCGIGFANFLSSMNVPFCQSNYPSVDSENESYELRVIARNLKEEQKIVFTSISLNIYFHYPFSDHFGIYGKAGLEPSFPVMKTYRSEATIDYNGYYPQYNVTLYDLPEYGFPYHVNTIQKGSLPVKTFVMRGVISAGFFYKLSRDMEIMSGIHYGKTMQTVSDIKTTRYNISSRKGEINSLMSAAESLTLSSLGIYLNLRYYFK